MHSDVDAELQDDRDLHHVLSSWRDHLKRRQLEEDFSTLQGRPRPTDVRARKSHDMRRVVADARYKGLPCDLEAYFRFVNGWREDMVTRFVLAAFCRNLPLHNVSVFSTAYSKLQQTCPLCAQRHEPDHR